MRPAQAPMFLRWMNEKHQADGGLSGPAERCVFDDGGPKMESHFGWLQERAKDMILPQSEGDTANAPVPRPSTRGAEGSLAKRCSKR